jgi:hypothetical protein
LQFAVGNNSDAGIAGVRSADANCDMVFGTRGSGSGAITERMRIDSSGRVTMPYQPAFRAYTTTDYTSDGAMTGSPGVWAEQFDRNNNFSNGTFTAPVAGVYLVTVMWDALSVLSTVDLKKNGADFLRYEPTGTTNSWETHSYSTNVYLNVNDYIYLYARSSGGSNPFHMGSGYWGHFSATLIG